MAATASGRAVARAALRLSPAAAGLALLLAVAWGGYVAPAAAQEAGGRVLAADEALSLAEDQRVVMVDVRSPEEWHRTGVPAGAHLVTIHHPDGLAGFLVALDEALGADRDRPIALICARGNRSTLASSALAQAGYTRVYNIREGMLGSPDGPGWLARGLPTEPCSVC